MQQFHPLAATFFAKALDLSADEILPQLVRPPKPEMGDIGFPCFPLAKQMKCSPVEVAKNAASQLQAELAAEECFGEVKAVGPYLNVMISHKALVQATVLAVLEQPDSWGNTTGGQGKTLAIDYSHPNIAKPLAVHHIRSTMIGAALCRLYRACGWRVVGINHIGDWGTNFGQLMVSYKRASAENPEVPVDIDALLKLYIQYHADAEQDEAMESEARAWFKKLEDGDEEATRLWEIFVEESKKPLYGLYDRLGVTFESWTGESFFNDKMEATIGRIRDSDRLQKSEGAEVVDLEAWGMPACLVRKSDGATTYATRDLAAAEYRHDQYGFDKSLYVVGNQQELHFRQVFKVLELMGYDWAAKCEHVKFGMLSFGPGVIGEEAATGSTRKGNIVFLDEVLDRAVARAKEIILANAREEEVTASAEVLAEQVGVGAVMFSEFLQRRTKDVTFTWEKALNLQGDSGPYLQYTHARLSSVRRKYSHELPSEIDWERLASSLERDILVQLAGFPTAIELAVRENEPGVVATYLLELAAVFNRMFTDKANHRIVSEDEALSAARIGLVEAVRITLANGLGLLGLAAPERM